jgi:hypothetical protein
MEALVLFLSNIKKVRKLCFSLNVITGNFTSVQSITEIE